MRENVTATTSTQKRQTPTWTTMSAMRILRMQQVLDVLRRLTVQKLHSYV